MAYPIVIHPNTILTTPARPIDSITDELLIFLDQMRETMIAHDGVGLAAPQVGKNISIALVELDEETGLFEMIDPEIIFRSGTCVDVEGCLSVPGVYGTVERSKEVTVRYFDREGVQYEVTASGYLARCFQHEIDHLEGILFLDKIIERIPQEDLEKYMEEHQND